MRVERSASNILFGHLPGQTIDAERGVWRVVEWRSPPHEPCRDPMLRDELIRQAFPWESSGTDRSFVADLRSGVAIELVGLGSAGVRVEPFPRRWQCRRCKRVTQTRNDRCRCGSGDLGQLPFVAFHDCGRLEEPWLPTCPQHREVRLVNPGTGSARDLRLECPQCDTLLQRGFGFRTCSCGQGVLQHTVHRAASVFTPRTAVVVNATDPEVRTVVQATGGAQRALEWIFEGMVTQDVTKMPPTRDSMVDDLVSKGIPRPLAESMAEQAVAAGAVRATPAGGPFQAADQVAAERDAMTIATSLYGSRTSIEGLGASGGNQDRRVRYQAAFAQAGIEAVDLVDRFPVLTAVYGFTRGEMTPGRSTLVPFRMPESNAYAVYVERSETEALFVRLDPVRVHAWLRTRGFPLPEVSTAEEARRTILAHARWPSPGQDSSQQPGLGETILTLVHSYAHRVLRRLPVLAGIDRDALSELLVPAHLGFFVYAAPRGSFVLGGLQALFESDLDVLFADVAFAEHRCAMDPGCDDAGGACACCLHVGEPSCRWFNTFLGRSYLHGPGGAGYLRG